MKGIAETIWCDKCGEVATYTISESNGKHFDFCDKCYEEYHKVINKAVKNWLKETKMKNI